MFIEFLIPIFLGISAGIFIGMMPGIGLSLVLVSIYPLLFLFNLSQLFLFFFAAINSSQYYGSIIATVFGLPGEVSSIPAVKYGHPLYLQNRGHEVIGLTSTSSFFAACLSIVFFYLAFQSFNEYILFLLKGKVILFLLSLLILISIVNSINKVRACIFLAAGLYLGKVGLDNIFGNTFVPFNLEFFKYGIPLFPLMCGLIIIPTLLGYKKVYKHVGAVALSLDVRTRIKWITNFKHILPAIKGSIIGFVCGLIPGASYTISSNIAEQSEKDPIKKIVSAEAANNAGSVSVLIPFLLLGIPIVPSESIILGIAETKGYFYTNSIEFFNSNILIISISLLLINFINWILSGYFYNTIITVYNQIYKYSYIILGIASILIMLWFAWQSQQLLLSCIIFSTALVFGIIIKDTEVKFLLIMGYFISPIFIDEFYRTFFI